VRKLSAEEKKLRRAIKRSLRAQGFHFKKDSISFRQRNDKRSIRKRHALAVAKQIVFGRRSLEKFETELLKLIASGTDVDPLRIAPRLHQVEPGTIESRLFKYACLHWSVPVSDGYGRRLRFLIFDNSNNKLIGLFGLSDPVYSIRARDEWIGWDSSAKADRLYHVLDAYVLGAVPPYSHLLGGKLVAMAAACDEVRHAFARRYANHVSLISGKVRSPKLALITTASALGRSSLFNRVRYGDRIMFQNVGVTSGWGEFHFSDGVYEQLTTFASRRCIPTAKQKKWGTGFRNRRELVRKVLSKLGFSPRLLNHGIKRQLFVIPLAKNGREFLRGEHTRLRYYKMSFDDIAVFWRKRWLLPRAARDESFRNYRSEMYRLWKKETASKKALDK
jgi:Domain of unknown function (DUF4338)